MKVFAFLFSLTLCVISMPSTSWGHFIWITAGSQTKDGKVHIYFAEDASPDDPALLKKITQAQLRQLAADGKSEVLKTSIDADSLVAEPNAASGESVFALSHEYGVMTRGPEAFLLKYHAKSQPSSQTRTWRAIGGKEQPALELVARADGDKTVFTLLWQGRPLADSVVTVMGPGIESKLETPTNDKGEVSFELKSPGLYSIRAKNAESIAGESNGQKYAAIRHYATLTLRLGKSDEVAATNVKNAVSALPALDPGITSFGAAIIGDDLYVYGGHFGQPHHYSTSGQSGQLLRLNLAHPAKWEVVATGPKRTGLAAVAHGGKFYRIGGFEARNSDDEKQSLFSTSDFARFDPKTAAWQDLPAMPTGRSSHDALVIGDTLYVVGGWELQGEGNSTWHDTAYTVDLAASSLEWKSLPKPPFQRRALSLGEWQGKVYAIGGMQPEGGPTTSTSLYDPKSGTWTDGPKLNGEPMEGFGSSAFMCAGKLCVSTFAGNLQILSADGSQWVNSEKLAYPRFFHRMLPLNASQVIVVGGASMKTGKIRELETVSVVPSSSD